MIFSTQTEFLAKKYGLVKAVEMLADAGYPSIDVSMFDLQSEIYRDDYRETAEKLLAVTKPRGVIFNQAHAPFSWKPDVYTNELVPMFSRAFEFCALLGIGAIVIHPRQLGKYYGREEQIFDANVDFYKSIAPLAKQHGVKIAIENMWQRHYETGNICDDILAPPEQLARMYDTLNDPEVFTVCLDLGHVALCGREPEDAIRALGHDRLGCLHVHDVDYRSDLHTLPGSSRIKWQNVCEALAEIDYKGILTLEADGFFRGFFEEMYPTVAKFMADTARSLCAKIDSLRSE